MLRRCPVKCLILWPSTEGTNDIKRGILVRQKHCAPHTSRKTASIPQNKPRNSPVECGGGECDMEKALALMASAP